jgi:FAD binding domain
LRPALSLVSARLLKNLPGVPLMRKKSALILVVIALAALALIGRPILFLAWVWWRDGANAQTMPTAGRDDASRLNSSQPMEVIKLETEPDPAEKQLAELVKRATREGLHISISGAQHSMGGHTLYPGGIALDMHPFNHLELDEKALILTAGAGARWSEVIPYLDQRGYAVSVMQTNNDFSVGGSISVNCHGWQNDMPPIASTVRSFRILTASGKVVRCSRTENRELFSLALGGYGLFGVILEVDLQVVPNDYYDAEAHPVAPQNYAEAYYTLTRGKPDIGMAYGRLSVAPASFLEEARITLLRRKTTDRPVKHTLVDEGPSLLKRLVFRGGVESDYGKNLRW